MTSRCKKQYTVKQWRRFKKTKVTEIDGVKHHIDLQELLCKKYEIILTDYKTKWERIKSILKKINSKNIDKGINVINMAINEFGKAVDELTKDLGNSKNDEQDNDKVNLEKFWGKSKNSINLWSESSEDQSDSQKSRDEINLEKLWGKRK